MTEMLTSAVCRRHLLGTAAGGGFLPTRKSKENMSKAAQENSTVVAHIFSGASGNFGADYVLFQLLARALERVDSRLLVLYLRTYFCMHHRITASPILPMTLVKQYKLLLDTTTTY